MESIKFPEVNAAVGESQKEYNTLYSNIDPTKPGCPFTFCLKLTDEEMSELIINKGELWVTQTTNGNLFQPISVATIKPPLKSIDLTKYK